LFQKYGNQYSFDPLMLAAQGYQESQLNQNAKSHVGAVGVMQLMPATGEQMKVGDIHLTEANIHAGAKYMDQLMTTYFGDAHFSEGNRPLFAFAAYNCGAGNVAKARKTAEGRGLDPNKWFNNVELVIAQQIGTQPRPTCATSTSTTSHTDLRSTHGRRPTRRVCRSRPTLADSIR
jgi:membrane-bound lytic murein transglycosylase MltF